MDSSITAIADDFNKFIDGERIKIGSAKKSKLIVNYSIVTNKKYKAYKDITLKAYMADSVSSTELFELNFTEQGDNNRDPVLLKLIKEKLHIELFKLLYNNTDLNNYL